MSGLFFLFWMLWLGGVLSVMILCIKGPFRNSRWFHGLAGVMALATAILLYTHGVSTIRLVGVVLWVLIAALLFITAALIMRR